MATELSDHCYMDINTLAKSIVDQATGDKQVRVKNNKAIERGKRRAAALEPSQRKAIAEKASASRWNKER